MSTQKLGVDELEKGYEEITSATFDHDGAHLASCHILQGGPSNGRPNALLLKGSEDLDQELVKALEQIQVTLSFEEYLRNFFDMWYSDAALLTKLMGFETEDEYRECTKEEADDGLTYLERKLEKVDLLKSTENKEFKDLSAEEAEVVKSTLTTFIKGVAKNPEDFDSFVNKTSSDSKEETVIEKTQDSDSKDSNINVNKEGNLMAKQSTDQKDVVEKATVDATELVKSAEVQDLIKAQVAEIVKAKDAEIEAKDAELTKTAEALDKVSARLDAMDAAEAERIEKGYSAMVTGFTFTDEESAQELTKALMTLRKSEDAEAKATMGTIVATLEKAQASIDASLQAEVGVDGEIEKSAADTAVADLDALIASQYGEQLA